MAAEDFVYIMANPSKRRRKTANGVFVPLAEGQIALLEVDDRHPYDKRAGERRVLVVHGRPPVLAYQTEAVSQRLVEKQIVIVNKAEAEKMIADYPAKLAAERAAATANPDDDEIAEDELAAMQDEKPKRSRKKAADKTEEPTADEAETDDEE